ncbi:hypothetical protein I315_06254 [Cryptococcus gattii Ru294]|nr:hypothetical protein I315_06254 [Cryptococcus gattii Ru294]
MSLLSHLVKFLLLGSIMASPSGHLIFTSLSAIFEGPYAPVFSAILCTQALPTLKSQISILKVNGKMSLEMAKEKCGGLRYVENRVTEGESSHNLLSTCKFFHLFVESLHNESADTSVEYIIHQQLQEYKITPISQNWMQMDMPLSAVPSDGSHVKKRLSMGVDTRENGTEAYHTWFLKKRAEYESGHDVCNQLSMLEAAVTSWAHLCLFLPKLNCGFVTLVMIADTLIVLQSFKDERDHDMSPMFTGAH